MDKKVRELYGYWKEHYGCSLANGDIDYIFSIFFKKEKEIEELKRAGDKLRESCSHKIGCQFSSCTCGAVKEQKDALLEWGRLRRKK